MRFFFSFLMLMFVCSTYSQSYSREEIDSISEKNYDKSLNVVAPIDENGSENSGQETVSSLTMKDANKVKLVDYSNVRPSDVYKSNEDGTRTAKGDSYNSTTGEISNDKEVDNSFNYEQTNNIGSSSLGGKLFKIGVIIALWFLLGFLINFFFYSGKPDYLVGKSQSAKNFHIILNIVTVIALLANIFT